MTDIEITTRTNVKYDADAVRFIEVYLEWLNSSSTVQFAEFVSQKEDLTWLL